MTKKIILIDADGVLFDFVTPALAAVARLGGPRVHHDKLDRYDIASLVPETRLSDYYRAVTAENFCKALKPYPGALELVERLRAVGRVVCVTSPMRDGRTWQHERREALQRHYDFYIPDVISCTSKELIYGDVFIDDHPDHVMKWLSAHEDHGGQGHLLDRPWNRGPKYDGLHRQVRAKSLESIVNLLEHSA